MACYSGFVDERELNEFVTRYFENNGNVTNEEIRDAAKDKYERFILKNSNIEIIRKEVFGNNIVRRSGKTKEVKGSYIKDLIYHSKGKITLEEIKANAKGTNRIINISDEEILKMIEKGKTRNNHGFPEHYNRKRREECRLDRLKTYILGEQRKNVDLTLADVNKAIKEVNAHGGNLNYTEREIREMYTECCGLVK